MSFPCNSFKSRRIPRPHPLLEKITGPLTSDVYQRGIRLLGAPAAPSLLLLCVKNTNHNQSRSHFSWFTSLVWTLKQATWEWCSAQRRHGLGQDCRCMKGELPYQSLPHVAVPCKHAALAFSKTSWDWCLSAPSSAGQSLDTAFIIGPSCCCPCSCGTFHRGSTFRRGAGEHQDPRCFPTRVQSQTGAMLTTTTLGQHSGGTAPSAALRRAWHVQYYPSWEVGLEAVTNRQLLGKGKAPLGTSCSDFSYWYIDLF